MKKVEKNIIMEDAKLIFRNFSGEEGEYNRKGDRNFCVLLDTPFAEELLADGWNVKWLQPREEGDEPQGYLPVAVSYRNFPPNVVQITSGGQTHLHEDMVGSLDWAEIALVDLIINPYNWEVNGKTGVKAYLKSMYVTLFEDELALKYNADTN